MIKNHFLLFVFFSLSFLSFSQNPTPTTYDIGQLQTSQFVESNVKNFKTIFSQKNQSKISNTLNEVFQLLNQKSTKNNLNDFNNANSNIHLKDDKVLVEFIAEKPDSGLLKELIKLGLEGGASYGHLVSGWFPVKALGALESLQQLRYARETRFIQHTGSITSRGDQAQRSDQARANFNVDGSGITVGVISDSYNCLGGAPDDLHSGDLPNGIQILDDNFCTDAIDEGRAMLQLVHDVAPGADLAFHTASGGQANFASGIVELATVAQADVIVDDIFYFAEPFFQDGIIAQAVETVTDLGVTYVSSAGNQYRDSYEANFRNSGVNGAVGVRHDFDPGPGVQTLQTITIPPGRTPFSLQWDQPFFSVSGAPGASSDLALVYYLPDGTFLGLASTFANIGNDAVDVFTITNSSGNPLPVKLGLEWVSGEEPNKIKYVIFNNAAQIQDFPTHSSTIVGHANARTAIATGAAPWFNTPEFNPNVNQPLLENFSSAGNTFILFNTDGRRQLDIRLKPEVVGPDAGNTTFFARDLTFPVPGTTEPDGFPNFFGTSASAPHIAGIVALMLENSNGLNPNLVKTLLQFTATDMDDPITPYFDFGYDEASGFGFVDADAAVSLASIFKTRDLDHFIKARQALVDAWLEQAQSHQLPKNKNLSNLPDHSELEK